MATTPGNPWPRRLAWATLLAAVPLLLLGGTVTTLRAGMAIDGWLVLEPGRGDHFLLAYPVEKWFRDAGTFSEHSHRLFGTLVGLFSILYVVAACAFDRRREVVACAVASLVAICAQGALGGFRVLENSQDLAFLHGSFAQAVFALLAANVVLTSKAWRELARSACKRAAPARRWGWAALIAVYAQIVLGAWLRHSGAALPFALHLLGVVAVVAALVAAARQWKLSYQDGQAGRVDRSPLRRAARNVHLLLGVQLLLGLCATVAVLVYSGGFQGRVSTGEMIFATAHVMGGALLLAQCLAGVLWSYRLVATAQEALACSAELGGSR
jgi:heme a synthase